MNHTTITDIDISFGRMVAIILKWMLASIPAILLMYALLGGIALVFALLFGGLIGGSGILENLETLQTPPSEIELPR